MKCHLHFCISSRSPGTTGISGVPASPHFFRSSCGMPQFFAPGRGLAGCGLPVPTTRTQRRRECGPWCGAPDRRNIRRRCRDRTDTGLAHGLWNGPITPPLTPPRPGEWYRGVGPYKRPGRRLHGSVAGEPVPNGPTHPPAIQQGEVSWAAGGRSPPTRAGAGFSQPGDRAGPWTSGCGSRGGGTRKTITAPPEGDWTQRAASGGGAEGLPYRWGGAGGREGPSGASADTSTRPDARRIMAVLVAVARRGSGRTCFCCRSSSPGTEPLHIHSGPSTRSGCPRPRRH
jgi:hypothetical protein